MTLTKISNKINQAYKIGTPVLERYDGEGVINGYEYCKNYGCELPIVKFSTGVVRFTHPDCLSIVSQSQSQTDFQEEENWEPPDPDDYLGQSLPFSAQTLYGIRRLDRECQRVRVEINFLAAYLIHADAAGTLFAHYCDRASKQIAKLRDLLNQKESAAEQKAAEAKVNIDLTTTPWLLNPMEGWYTNCHIGG